MPRFAHLAVLASCLAAAPAVRADELHVPSEYATIQEAIDAAHHGDEVVLASGDYTELIDFKGKAITLRSGDGEWATITYDLAAGPAGIRMVSGEGPDTRLYRLGFEAPPDDPNAVFEFMYASPTIERCYFDRGSERAAITATNSHLAFIGCVVDDGTRDWISLELSNSTVVFDDCTLSVRLADDPEAPSHVTFTDCTFINGINPNTYYDPPVTAPAPSMTIEGWSHSFGALQFHATLPPQATLLVRDCDFGDAFNDSCASHKPLSLNIAGGEARFEGCTFGILQSLDYCSDHHPVEPFFTVKNGGLLRFEDCSFERFRYQEQGDDILDATAPFFATDAATIEMERCTIGGFISHYEIFNGEIPSPLIRVADGTLVLRDAEIDNTEPNMFLYSWLIGAERSDVVLERTRLHSIQPVQTNYPLPLATSVYLDGGTLVANALAQGNLDSTPAGQGTRVYASDACTSASFTACTELTLQLYAGQTRLNDCSSVYAQLGNTDVLAESSAFTSLAAWYATGTVRDCQITLPKRDTSSGSLPFGYNNFWHADLVIEHCTYAVLDGGRDYPLGSGVYRETSGLTFFEAPSPTFIDCAFADSHGGPHGGMLSTWGDADPTFINCTFRATAAEEGGSVVYAGDTSHPTFINCEMTGSTITDPGAALGGVIATDTAAYPDARVDLLNCTIWGHDVPGPALVGNVAATNCLVQGLAPLDPLFKRAPDAGADGWFDDRSTAGVDESADNDYGDLRLAPGSPAIDAGDTAALPPDTFDLDADSDTAEVLPIDIAGDPRVVDDPDTPDTGTGGPPVVDLGAYERAPEGCPADIDGSGHLNFDDIDIFASAFVAGDLLADLDDNAVLNLDDIAAFADSFIAGCP